MSKRSRILLLLLLIAVAAGAVLRFAVPSRRLRPTAGPGRPTPSSEVTLLLVGDIMLSRFVGTRIARAQDPGLPFKNLASLLASADVTFGNLEAPFLDSGPRVTEGMVFKAEPQTVQGLAAAGFDVVSIANNHALDRGIRGLRYTRDWLLKHNILPVGAGDSDAETHEGRIVRTKGQGVGFLAYSYFDKPPYIAGLESERLREDITRLKKVADFVVVSVHAGSEYTVQPHRQQIAFAHTAIDAGADIVVGHHPHWIQPVERYNGGLILYSLGNFVFDQSWSQRTMEGLVAELKLRKGRPASVRLYPIVIERGCCPRLADSSEARQILKKINMKSATL